MNAEQLRRLHELVHAAEAVVQRPFEEGETSRPIEFFTDHLSDEGWLLGWMLVAAIRAENPEILRFYDEERLHQAALDCVVEAPALPSPNEIVAAVRTEAESQTGDWLVSIPLAKA